MNVPTGDIDIVDLIDFVFVDVIDGEFVTEKLLLDDGVTDDDLECMLLVFVGEFVDDGDVRVDLDMETDPVDVLELLIDFVFVPEEDEDAVADADLE